MDSKFWTIQEFRKRISWEEANKLPQYNYYSIGEVQARIKEFDYFLWPIKFEEGELIFQNYWLPKDEQERNKIWEKHIQHASPELQHYLGLHTKK